MPLEQTRSNKVGNVLKREFSADTRYCRKMATVDYAEGMEVGEVLIFDTDAYRPLVAGDDAGIVSAELVVLIDDTVDELIASDLKLETPTDQVEVAVLYKGPVELKLVGLSFGGAAQAGVLANLDAVGMKTSKVYSAKTASRLS